MFNPTIYENSTPDGVPVLEIEDRSANADPATQLHHFVPLQRTVLQGTILGPLADLQLTQTFQYDHGSCADAIEARYRFPLPGDAAVLGVTVHFGEVEIVTNLQERTVAEAAYATAKAEGRQATLATREAANVFTLQIAGLQPGQPVTVETHFVQLARPDRGLTSGRAQEDRVQWSLRIPLTTAPRYVRADELTAREAQAQPLLLLRDPGHRFSLDLTFQGVDKVTSPTHRLTVAPSNGAAPASSAGDQIRVQLAAGAVVPDRDCLLQWSPPQSDHEPALSLLTHWDQAQQRLYFLALVTPPAQRPPNMPAREVILLVDHSGSMSGAKWSAADWAVERFLGKLQPTDSFALAMFHYETRWLAQHTQPATAANVAHAIQWLSAQRDSGGTELGVALEQALLLPHTLPATESALARNILVMTDAAVSDAARLLRLADAEAQSAKRRRISVLCIDAAPNAFLAHELAERGGGVAYFLTSNPAESDIVTALDEVMQEWAQPLLVNLKLLVNRSRVIGSGRRTADCDNRGHPTEQHADGGACTAVDLGDLVAGQARWVVGVVPMADWPVLDQPLVFSLVDSTVGATPLATAALSGHRDPVANRSDGSNARRAPNAVIKALYGARQVNGLEYLQNAGLDEPQLAEQLARLGYDPAQIATPQNRATSLIYAENRRQHTAALIRPLLVAAALDFGLASTETAFVATREECGNTVTASVTVANALPVGWSNEFTGRTNATTPMPMAQLAPAFGQPTAPGSGDSRPGPFTRMAQRVSAFVNVDPLGRPQGVQAVQPKYAGAEGTWYELFSGGPKVHMTEEANGQPQIVLFDSRQSGGATLPDDLLITALRLQFAEGEPGQPTHLVAQQKAALLLYIGDQVTPRATIRLSDLAGAGTRPLNVRRVHGEVLVVALVDPTNDLQSHNVTFSLLLQGH